MHQAASQQTILPHMLPECPYSRLLLFTMRRMAAGGLADAHAAQAMLAGFGIGFRRPLVLVRALMAEVARVSSTKLMVAPCCCGRMTADERILLAAIGNARSAPAAAHKALARLLHVHDCLGLLTSAQAVGEAFADLGMPLASAVEA